MASVAVVGVGAIGGVLAGLLERAGGHEVTWCTRRPLASLTIDAPDGIMTVQAQNWTDPAQASPVDWVLIATKTYDAKGAKLWLERLCGAETRIAVVQNGVEHRERFASWTVLPVMIDVPAERVDEGRVLQRARAMIRVEAGARGAAFVECFAGSGADVEVTPDFLTAAWRKLCLNAAGAVSALTMQPAGILRDPEMGQVALDLVAECVAVGRAAGAQLEDGLPDRVLAGARAGSPDSINSMLADRIAGRQTEVEARNGVIVRLGDLYQIATPANRMATALLKRGVL